MLPGEQIYKHITLPTQSDKSIVKSFLRRHDIFHPNKQLRILQQELRIQTYFVNIFESWNDKKYIILLLTSGVDYYYIIYIYILRVARYTDVTVRYNFGTTGKKKEIYYARFRIIYFEQTVVQLKKNPT